MSESPIAALVTELAKYGDRKMMQQQNNRRGQDRLEVPKVCVQSESGKLLDGKGCYVVTLRSPSCDGVAEELFAQLKAYGGRPIVTLALDFNWEALMLDSSNRAGQLLAAAIFKSKQPLQNIVLVDRGDESFSTRVKNGLRFYLARGFREDG